MRKKNSVRAVIIINESSRERKEFTSMYAAARFLGAQFLQIQRAALYNGAVAGWRVYETADAIRQHIKDLEDQLRVVESL
jgi:hypothetical protein